MKKSFSYAPNPFKNMPKEFKKKEVSNIIYIVDHDKNGKKVPKRTLNARIKSTEKFLLNLFGGYTSIEHLKGEFINNEKKILSENVYKIACFSDINNFKKSEEKLKKWLIKSKKEWNQESIAFEFEGDMYYL